MKNNSFTSRILFCVGVFFVTLETHALTCTGLVNQTNSDSSGYFYITGSWSPSVSSAICNVSTTWNGIAPSQCATWEASLMMAYRSHGQVSITYNTSIAACNLIPASTGSPAPASINSPGPLYHAALGNTGLVDTAPVTGNTIWGETDIPSGLMVEQNITSATQASTNSSLINGISNYVAVDPSRTNAAATVNVYDGAYETGTAAVPMNSVTGYNMTIYNNSTSTLGQMMGGQKYLDNLGTGNGGWMYGDYDYVSNDGGTVYGQQGIEADVNNSATMSAGGSQTGYQSYISNGGTMTNGSQTGLRLYIENYSATSSIANQWGEEINLYNSGTGTNAYGSLINVSAPKTTTAYGLYIGTVTGVTSYGLYQAGTSNDYFGGKVGIGTKTPAQPLAVVGTAGAAVASFGDGTHSCTVTPATSGAITCTSDVRLKKDIQSMDTEEANALMASLNPVHYRWKSGHQDIQTGFIAQEVEKAAPGLVTTDSAGYKQVGTMGLIPAIVRSIQDLLNSKNETENRFKNLEDRLQKLEAENASLKAQLGVQHAQ